MKRKDVIKMICNEIPKSVGIISTTGLISREIFSLDNSERNFYMTGSFGLSSSMGLGIALSGTNRKIVSIDGDASILTNLGSMTTISRYSPKQLIHICIDNSAYGSCSEEPSATCVVNLDSVARVIGYRHVYRVENKSNLKKAIFEALKNDGPTFILIKIELGGDRHLPRPLDLVKVCQLFKYFLSK